MNNTYPVDSGMPSSDCSLAACRVIGSLPRSAACILKYIRPSLSDLDKLAEDDPARPVVKQLLEWLTADGDFPDHPYDPEEHGYIALVESGDVQRELDDIDMPRLTEILWEGVSIIDGYYHVVYLGAGDYGIGFVIPVDADWVSDDLREVLDSLLRRSHASHRPIHSHLDNPLNHTKRDIR